MHVTCLDDGCDDGIPSLEGDGDTPRSATEPRADPVETSGKSSSRHCGPLLIPRPALDACPVDDVRRTGQAWAPYSRRCRKSR